MQEQHTKHDAAVRQAQQFLGCVMHVLHVLSTPQPTAQAQKGFVHVAPAANAD
jgi:hypothetical protein